MPASARLNGLREPTTFGHAHKMTHNHGGTGAYTSVAPTISHYGLLLVPKSDGAALEACPIVSGPYVDVPWTYTNSKVRWFPKNSPPQCCAAIVGCIYNFREIHAL